MRMHAVRQSSAHLSTAAMDGQLQTACARSPRSYTSHPNRQVLDLRACGAPCAGNAACGPSRRRRERGPVA
eukprot:5403723-Pleurochrysis_carterae.AAC.1